MSTKSLSSLKPRERNFAGFILNKLWTNNYWCGEGRRQHGGHTSKTNLPKGLPRSDAGEVQEIVDKLIKLGFICKVSATRDIHVCASRSPEKIDDGLVVVNEYRASVGLVLLKRDQI